MTSNTQIIHADSKLCAQSELELFESPPTLAQVEKTTCVGYRASSTLTDASVLDFFIAGTGEEYIDLQQTKIHLEVSIRDHEGNRVPLTGSTPAGQPVIHGASDKGPAPINNFCHSLFSQVDVYFNDKQVSSSNNLYPYRAYLENLLNHGKDSSESHLSCALYYHDTPGELETFDKENKGLIKRLNIAFQNESFDMIAPLHVDCFNQNRYLLNNVDVKIRLTRSHPNFCLVTKEAPANGYKVIVKQATLFMHKVKLAPSLLLAHAQLLTRNPVKYPMHRVEMKSFSIPVGTLNANRDNLVLGQLPTHILVGLVDSEAESGNYVKNPFNFKHFNLKHLSLQIGSEQIPSQPLQPDYNNNLYIREYQGLIDALGYWRTDKGITIDRSAYANGYTLYGFNLSSSAQQCSEAFSLLKQGNLQMNLKFAQALPNSVMVICHMTFENMMEIDQMRNILFDYSM